MSFRSGYQVCGNEHPVYTALIAGFQLGIRRGARSIQIRTSFIKRNKNSQELKGWPENLKVVAALSYGLDYHPVPSSHQFFFVRLFKPHTFLV
jgi:hypothetical protein